jgi:outer membrane receptor protein involved in Fe transport
VIEPWTEEEIAKGEWTPLDRFYHDFLYDERIYAAYVQASETFGRLSLKAGIRTEYSDIRTELQRTNEVNDRNYIDFFPSAFVSYKVREKNTVQASYSRRINRPGFWWLVPFMQYADSRNYRSGNPDLNPEYAHAFELAYQRFLEKGNILTSVYYRHKMDVMQRITFVEPDGLTRMIPVNLATENNFGWEFNMNYDIQPWWEVNGNVNFYYSNLQGNWEDQNFDTEAFIWDFKTNSQWTILKRVDVQLSFDFEGPRNTAQGRSLSRYNLEFGASVDVFKQKGTVTLSVRDIFNTRVRRWETTGPDFRTEGDFQWRQTRMVKLSFNYRFK